MRRPHLPAYGLDPYFHQIQFVGELEERHTLWGQPEPLAGSGKSALLAMKIWAEDQNEGGLLGRPVELVYYDDQSNPANVPPIYTKLLDVDKVDLRRPPTSLASSAAADSDLRGLPVFQVFRPPCRSRASRLDQAFFVNVSILGEIVRGLPEA